MNRLFKSRDKMIFGVCGGIANYANIDPSIIRILWVVLTICTFSLGFWIYIAAAIIIPREP
jgi:phage shock protein PspC (stress-responsive transcriptional regulator)